MTDSHDRLTAALAGRYRIIRELGQGGMATVYLAEDLKHHRQVAIKVLRPDLAATIGPERFAREIEVAARLQHPHILGLLDSGDADSFFYYVMPFVEGETLRDRLARSGELPVPEAVRLLSEIADALAVAHRAGVVHRDIKPENVLLSGRHAMVMDFGVAKALTEAAGSQQLTTAGVALGTPAYMAPEQASADPTMDARVDIYALGVLGYEMLTGHTVFPGLNPQQTLAAHVTQTPTPVGQQRSGLSPALEAVVMRCLAKRPADRFQTADELVSALEPLAMPSGGMTPTHTQPVKAATVGGAGISTRTTAIAAALVVVAAVALFIWKPWAGSGGQPLDPDVVAVLPFRVAGADQSVQYLRQGMVDLLQAKLTGEGGPRAADTRSVLAAVRDAGGGESDDLPAEAVTRVARKIGAGRVLQGSIVGPPDHLVISASLVAIPSGRTVAQTTVDGPKDSLFVLVDRLTAQLLALGAGAKATQLTALTTTNLEALRAYLDGITAFRRTAFDRSTPLFERAVQLDSTFALALSALLESDGWSPAAGDMNRVRQLAWQYRDRLNPQDQRFLTLRLGSMYPRQTPWNVQIADAEKAAQAMPESPEAWFYLGDALFHGGRLADIPEPEARARQAFEKSFELDSLYGGAITHLARLNFVVGDTAAQRVWARREFALDSTGENVHAARWDLLQSTRDAAGIKAFLAGLPSLPIDVSRAILFQNPRDSVTIAHQPELLEIVHQLATNRAERNDMAFSRWFYLLNGGRPDEADRWLDTLRTINPGGARLQSVLGAIWYGGNLPDTTTLADNPGAQNVLRFSQGNLSVAPAVLKEAREAAAKDTLQGFWYHWGPLLEAWVAVEQGRPEADRLVDVADSLWRGRQGFSTIASLQLARLYEKQGRPDRALRAVRRRYSANGEPEPPGLAEAYRLEGKYAAQLGDRADAIRAYRYYLRMRHDPEPSRMPQRDSVLAELAKVGDLEGAKTP